MIIVLLREANTNITESLKLLTTVSFIILKIPSYFGNKKNTRIPKYVFVNFLQLVTV